MKPISFTIAEKWDKNVIKRAEDLEKGTDLSYVNCIKPFVLEKVLKYSQPESIILDIGCGCGYLTNCIYEQNRKNVCGIDISEESIKYAKNKYNKIDFIHGSIYDFNISGNYNLCLAVMLLNNIPDIDEFFAVLNKVLSDKGKAIIVIPHPVFWTKKHLNNCGFNYLENDKSYEVPFKTKGRQDYESAILYFHRTIQKYINDIIKNNFKLLEFFELSEDNKNSESPDLIGMVIEKN